VVNRHKIRTFLVCILFLLWVSIFIGCVSFLNQEQPSKFFVVQHMGRNYRCANYKIVPLNGILVFIDYDTGQEITIRDHYVIKSP
jgi:hypothetical protein